MGFFSWLFGERREEAPVVHVDDGNFDAEVLRSELPVMLDVWGPGCTPCQHLEPIVMRLATRYRGRVKVAELNAAENPRTAARLGVRGTPTVLYFRKGQVVERVVGFRGEAWHDDIVRNDLGVGATADG
jgi:thioredoxin-like negative regulator of GroEL